MFKLRVARLAAPHPDQSGPALELSSRAKFVTDWTEPRPDELAQLETSIFAHSGAQLETSIFAHSGAQLETAIFPKPGADPAKGRFRRWPPSALGSSQGMHGFKLAIQPFE